MRDYELIVIVKPEILDENLPAVVERVTKFITEKGGTIAETNQWGRRKLAYPIKGAMEGNYVLVRFKGEPGLVSALEANLKLAEDILRHLLVRVEEPRPVGVSPASP